MDERLHQLIIEVLQADVPEKSPALERLLALIPHLPGIRKDPNSEYLEALNKTLIEVKRKLDKFPSQFRLNINTASAIEVRQCFVRWVNQFLKYDILDLYRSQKSSILSLDVSKAEEGEGTWLDNLANEGFDVPKIDGLESWIADQQKQKTQRKGLILELYIEHDPQGILRGSYPTNNHQCNCQRLTQRFFLSNPGGEVTVKEGNRRNTNLKAEKKEKWRAFATEQRVNYQTLKSHWKKCRWLLKKILEHIENNQQVVTFALFLLIRIGLVRLASQLVQGYHNPDKYTRDFLGEKQ